MRAKFPIIWFLPLQLAMVYLLVTVILFFWGPFDWPVDSVGLIFIFLIAILIGLCIGYLMGCCSRPIGGRLNGWRTFYRVGALLSICLVFPSTYVYTNKWPWEIWSVLGDQGLAYREMLEALEANESGIRAYVSLGRSIAAPFIYCVIPFAILNWRSLRSLDIILLVGHIGSILIFSFMRGTDREIGELIVFVSSTFLILGGRAIAKYGRLPFSLSRILASTFLLLVIFFSALTLFLDRKASRLGGEERVCIAETVVCSDRTSVDSPRLSFAAEMLSAYLAQGYYGLSLALNEDFTSTFGLGHSSFLMSAFSGLFDATLYERSYMYKVSQAGWDDKAQWSTMLVWIASDVGFPLVPVFILILGFLWGGAWKSSIILRSDAGAVVFVLLSLSVLYIPANNQLAQTLDSYLAFVFWLVVWIGQKGVMSDVFRSARL